MEGGRDAFKILRGTPTGKGPSGRPRRMGGQYYEELS